MKKPRSENEKIIDKYAAGGNADTGRVLGGVTVSWLAEVFRMDPSTVKKRLKDCPPVRSRKAGYLYDIAVASQYLVKPVFDVEAYIKGMKPSELPLHLQDQYWSALIKRQKWEEKAGNLWDTGRVIDVFSEFSIGIKSEIQMWVIGIDRKIGLDNSQKKELVDYCDRLQKNIYYKIQKMALMKNTAASIDQNAIMVDNKPEKIKKPRRKKEKSSERSPGKKI